MSVPVGAILEPLAGSEVPPADPLQQFSIRTDAKVDEATGTITATMELPGIHKSDLQAVLRTCPHSGMRLLTVSGVLESSKDKWTVQERKKGAYGRSLIVYPYTKVSHLRIYVLGVEK